MDQSSHSMLTYRRIQYTVPSVKKLFDSDDFESSRSECERVGKEEGGKVNLLNHFLTLPSSGHDTEGDLVE